MTFEADDAYKRQPVDFNVNKFISVVYIDIKPVNGSNSRFSVEGYSIYPKKNNTSSNTYSEMFTITAFDGKNTLQKQFKVRQNAGQGASTDMDVTFNGYNQENTL